MKNINLTLCQRFGRGKTTFEETEILKHINLKLSFWKYIAFVSTRLSLIP